MHVHYYVHIKCKCIHVVNALLLNSFPNKYLSRYNSDSLDYQWEPSRIQSRDLTTPLPLTIDINWKLATINVKPMGMILKLFIKTGNDFLYLNICKPPLNLDSAPYFADRFLSSGEDSIDQKICIGTWLIYAADLEEPKTGGGLRSKFYPDDIFFKRSRRVPHQYLGFVEDMMLILFLVCILITLVTVHRASCYRQFQDARRNTPLRHILPIAEDQPPPYSERIDSADGLVEVVEDENTGKRQSETPPPTYEEALYRNSVLLPRETSSVEIIPEGPITIIDNSLPSYNETRIRVFENSISIIQEESNVLDTCSTQPSDQSPPTLTECTVDSTEEKEETSLLPHEGSGSTSESSLSGPVCTVVHEEQTQQNEDDRASVSIIIENKHEIISSSAVQVIV
ncbi:uncharacterized protein LOC111708733 [Eurytemora carolleeae]|uniref:uncharacterized protein LOC111708733 n=1 Tax=Eurytemora carolleeae TaxID=1294199 RepID=UPI000C77AC08|nr:uncharacterized protein LOC111708733 [Eurytemora carolleeae]|eukprot:XP_023337958.1 uncharacterized protein LOC111708733 [Eurytemora affinis]